MNANDIVKEMTLEEKARFVTGKDFWRTQPIERHDIRSMLLIDGPHGLRKQVDKSDHLGINKAQNAVCFPAACALASSFDTELLERVGSFIGEEAQAENVAVVLGPANNIKRSPLCGRNFEYFSEDPYLAGKLAAAHIRGVQKHGIGTSLKHFAANNQEKWRNTVNAIIDERTLREMYLTAFEIPVRESSPMSVMCAYNRINGTYCAESHYLLTEILRDEWGFEGFVVSDWGAVDELHRSIAGGLDLEMPSSGSVGPDDVIKAVKMGLLGIDTLDRAVERIVNIFIKIQSNRNETASYDKTLHHNYACEIARECVVLLKNEGDILPLNAGALHTIGVIGEFAVTPRFQGGGSSHINPCRTENLLDCVKAIAADATVLYAKGYSSAHDRVEGGLVDEAVAVAKQSDAVIINAGLTEEYESEGWDRSHLNMPENQLALIKAVCKANANTIVVLSNGSPVKMPFEPEVRGIVEAWLPGQAGAKAVAEILFGIHNPSGKLAETFIRDEKDDPAYGNFPGADGEVVYSEGLYIGYRYHDRHATDVLYPFGYGLSYTNFEYGNIRTDRESYRDSDTVMVSADIRNTGSRGGKETVQLYIHEKNPAVDRPEKELKGFSKVSLESGETKSASFELNKRSFAYYHVAKKEWVVNSGEFEILIGKSSKEICLKKTIRIESREKIDPPAEERVYLNSIPTDKSGRITRNTMIIELKDHPVGKLFYRGAQKHIAKMFSDSPDKEDKLLETGGDTEQGDSDFNRPAMEAMILESPLRTMVSMNHMFSERQLRLIIFILNATRNHKLLGKVMKLIIR